MTFGTLAVIHDSATHPAKAFRNQTAAHLGLPMTSHANAVTATTRGGGHGVVGDGDMLVTFTSGLGYSVAAGRAFVAGSFAVGQGSYSVYNDAAVTGTLAARDATNPRISLICVRVRDTDTDASGGEDVGIVEVIGTAAATPAVPSIPSSLGSLLVLSQVTVPSSANGGAPTFSNVRPYASALGATIRCTSTTRPTGAALYTSLTIYELDTGLEYLWTGSSWRGTSPTVWTNQKAFAMSNITTFPSDLTIPFDAAAISGVGVVTVSTYVGFSTGSGNGTFAVYTNSYVNPPSSGGWQTGPNSVWSNIVAGQWLPGPTFTLHVPVTSGGSPNVIFRITAVSGTGNMYVRGSAVIQVVPGTWTNP